MRKFSDRNQRTKEINGLYQTWSHCQKQKGIKRNKFFSDFVFFFVFWQTALSVTPIGGTR
jgi:hypothetical protein